MQSSLKGHVEQPSCSAEDGCCEKTTKFSVIFRLFSREKAERYPVLPIISNNHEHFRLADLSGMDAHPDEIRRASRSSSQDIQPATISTAGASPPQGGNRCSGASSSEPDQAHGLNFNLETLSFGDSSRLAAWKRPELDVAVVIPRRSNILVLICLCSE